MSENSAVTNAVPNEVPNEVCKRLCEWLGLDTRSPITLWNSGNRTFTVGNDLLALKEKLAEDGLWRKFRDYAFLAYAEREIIVSPCICCADMWNWIFTPVRFALLVDEFLRRGGSSV
jgi:hypothetical protein